MSNIEILDYIYGLGTRMICS